VTYNDCRRQPLVLKQVKTFLVPPNLTAPPQTPGLDPPLVRLLYILAARYMAMCAWQF